MCLTNTSYVVWLANLHDGLCYFEFCSGDSSEQIKKAATGKKEVGEKYGIEIEPWVYR